MKISRYETMAARAGLQPVERGTAKGLDFFIADGFSAVPQRDFQKFMDQDDDFPFGAYGTLWLLAEGEDRVLDGGLCIFEAFHDLGRTADEKKQMRINTAKEKCEQYLATRMRVSPRFRRRLNGQA